MEPKDLMREFANDIKQLRLLKMMSRKMVCEKARVSENALRHLEGDGKATVETMIRVLQVLGKTDWILNVRPVVSINPLHMTKAGGYRKRGPRSALHINEPRSLTDSQKAEMKSFYSSARAATNMTGIKHEVDHIIPLLGDNVSGLHVPWNLQVITKTQNSRKNNHV